MVFKCFLLNFLVFNFFTSEFVIPASKHYSAYDVVVNKHYNS